VDSGFSSLDVQDPRRVSPIFHFVFRPPWKPEETALAGVHALGLNPKDIRHIVFTHLDYDHANGLADFPWTTAHAYDLELQAARSGPTLRDRLRYNRTQLRMHECWESYSGEGGDRWYGFQGIRPIKGLDNDVAFIPLLGHSAGHSGVAVRTAQGWLLHAGDAYMQVAELQPTPEGPAHTGLFQTIMRNDGKALQGSLARLSELHRDHGNEVQIFCSHDETEFDLLLRHK
jgi:glyoxylase-like metal-dependent hydrolase (beta-lactamase superfamily II)